MAASSSVSVKSMRLFRYACSEESHPLFQRAYARSNRAKGSKIVRCFPHCCPNHLPRRYCGCSLHVLVTFQVARDAVAESELVICARFEPLVPSDGDELLGTDGLLKHGSQIILPRYLFEPVHEGGEDLPWVLGVKESEFNQLRAPKDSIVYSLNKRSFPKWIYNFESGAARRRRQMEHTLRVYVFLLEPMMPGADPAQPRDGSRLARVIAHHESPSFLLVSYRRASTEQGRLASVSTTTRHQRNASTIALSTNVETEEVRSECDTTVSSLDFTSSVDMAAELISRASGQLQGDVDNTQGESKPCRRECDAPLWINQIHPDTQQKVQHLQVLFLLVNSVSLVELELLLPDLSSVVQDHWVCSQLTSAYHELTGQHLSILPILQQIISLSLSNPVRMNARVYPVILESVTLLLRALDIVSQDDVLQSLWNVEQERNMSGNIQRWVLSEAFSGSIDRVYDGLSNSTDLTDKYGRGCQEWPITAVESLADDALSLIYQEDSLHFARRMAFEILRCSQGDLCHESIFRQLAAQLNETTIKQACQDSASAIGTHRELWRGRWVLDVNSFRVRSVQTDLSPKGYFLHRPTVLRVLSWLHQIFCVDLDLDDQLLTITSSIAVPTSSRSESAMALVLDGRSRVFRTFPNGLASMVTLAAEGAWAWGDYFGSIAEDRRSANLVLFAFRQEDGEEDQTHPGAFARTRIIVYRLHATIKPQTAAAPSGKEFKALMSTVNVARSTYNPPLNEQSGSLDFAAMNCSTRVEVFMQLEWREAAAVDAGYCRIPV